MEASDVPMPMPTAPINRLSAPPLHVGSCPLMSLRRKIRHTPAESSVSSRRRVSGGVHTGLGIPQSAENPGLGLSQSAEVKTLNPTLLQ